MAHLIGAEARRVGGFIILRDADGRRHAIWPRVVLALSDTEDHTGTLLTFPGGRVMAVDAALDEVLLWFSP